MLGFYMQNVRVVLGSQRVPHPRLNIQGPPLTAVGARAVLGQGPDDGTTLRGTPYHDFSVYTVRLVSISRLMLGCLGSVFRTHTRVHGRAGVYCVSPDK